MGNRRGVFQLTASNPTLSQQLGFIARSVQVDNLTNQFLRLPGAGRDIPPFVYGAVIPIDGTQVAEASLIKVTPAPATVPSPGAAATLTFYDVNSAPDSGRLLTSSISGQESPLLPETTITPNNVQDIPIPQGTTALFLWMQITNGSQSEVSVFDLTFGGSPYFNTLLGPGPIGLTTPLMRRVLVDPGLGTTIRVLNQGPATIAVIVAAQTGAPQTIAIGESAALRPFDWEVQASFSGGSTPSLTTPTTVITQVQLVEWSADLVAGAATAYISGLSIKDNIGTTRVQRGMGVSAVVGATDHVGANNSSHLAGSLTMALALLPAGISAFMSMAGYWK